MYQKLILFFCITYPLFLQAQDLRGDSIDIRAYTIRMDVSDFATKVLKGDAMLGIKAKTNAVETIRLDLLKLNVDSVKVNSFVAPFTYNDTLLHINLLTTLNTGDSATVQIYYHGHPVQMPGDFGGFYWTNTYAFNIGVSFAETPHNYGRVWFPCFDNFEVRSNYEFYVTTKNTHKAFCNGTLQGVVNNGNKKIWHWRLSQPIPSYLASVAVASYATLSDTVHGINGIIPIELAAEAADTTTLKNLFIHLHEAFHIQEQMWGPYLWDRVGYCIVPFNAGAMEHATNIGFMSYYLNVYASQAETTMAHELSHHWFGNLVTCDSASEMWLNEGWARYNEYLFLGRLYGDSVYQDAVRLNHEDVLHRAHVSDGNYLPVNGVPTEQTYGKTVYDKGADVIHTLRTYMGDSLFFHCVKEYLSAYKWQTASTEQLQDFLSQCSAINLSNYFNDWVNSPGFTHFSIEKNESFFTQSGPEIFSGHRLLIRQQLSHANHYYQQVPLTVSMFTNHFGSWKRFDTVISVSGECTEVSMYDPWMEQPVYFAVDFDGKLQDAITDEWRVISDTGSFDFGTAQMVLKVNANSDSTLIRIEHNWLRPEPMHQKIPGLILHDKRYWTIDGIFNPNFSANATVYFDGHDVSLDSAFISNSEDSLLMMYRPASDSEWVQVNSFTLNNLGNSSDKVGYLTVNGIKKGQYCLAIRNSFLADTTSAFPACNLLSIEEPVAEERFRLFPNPVEQTLTLSFLQNVFVKAEIFDMTGRSICSYTIPNGETIRQISTAGFANGAYLVTLSTKSNSRTTQKLIKQ